MSDPISMTERQMTIGFFKLSILLTLMVVILGWVASLITERYQSIATNSLLFCMAFFMLSNAILGVLHILDWFEARRIKRNA